jgi:arylsulfatase A-like enzyme
MKERLGVISVVVITFTLFACTQQANEEQEVQEQAAVTVVGETSSDQHPNVVFILVDDLGFGDVGYNGSDIATPVLDQMAIDGVRLDRNYVYPVCSPTRAALLTGHNPLIHGVDGPLSIKEALPTDIQIMPEYFKQLGYQTFMVGKWHLGLGNTDYWPTARGFDSHYGFLGGWVDFYTHVHAGGLDWQREGKTVREEGHATDLLTAEALRVIESREQGKPFLLYMAYNAPHSPLQTTPVNSGLNDDVEVGDRRVYAEMVTQMDAAIGQIIDVLNAEGILEETIVVFSSDNGGSLPWGASNGSLSGGKGATMEGGIRVLGLVSWPGHVEGSRVLEQPVMIYDWLPTLLDAVGGDASAVHEAQGQSMWAAITDDAQVAPQVMVFGGRDHRAVIDWPWKLVRLEANGVRQDTQLFNIVDDPNEQNDLAAQHPEIISELLVALNAVPVAASKRTLSGNGAGSFYTGGDNKDYEARLEESREPWAEAAVRGSNGISVQ